MGIDHNIIGYVFHGLCATDYDQGGTFMTRESLGFEFALIGFLCNFLKLIDQNLDNLSQNTLKNIILYMVAASFIAFMLKQTETKSSPVKIVGVNFPPWLPSAICCFVATFFLMQL